MRSDHLIPSSNDIKLQFMAYDDIVAVELNC